MKKPAAKVFFLFSLYVGLHFLAACLRDPGNDCVCPNPDFPFFDYRAISVQTNDPISIGYLRLTVKPDSIDFVVEAVRETGLEWFPSAMACSCVDNGYQGDKYGIAALDVFADRDFNDTLRTAMPLNALFYTSRSDIMASMDNPAVRPVLFQYVDEELFLFLQEKPENVDQPYRFTIRLIKTNGDTLTAQTGEVRFQ